MRRVRRAVGRPRRQLRPRLLRPLLRQACRLQGDREPQQQHRFPGQSRPRRGGCWQCWRGDRRPWQVVDGDLEADGLPVAAPRRRQRPGEDCSRRRAAGWPPSRPKEGSPPGARSCRYGGSPASVLFEEQEHVEEVFVGNDVEGKSPCEYFRASVTQSGQATLDERERCVQRGERGGAQSQVGIYSLRV